MNSQAVLVPGPRARCCSASTSRARTSRRRRSSDGLFRGPPPDEPASPTRTTSWGDTALARARLQRRSDDADRHLVGPGRRRRGRDRQRGQGHATATSTAASATCPASGRPSRSRSSSRRARSPSTTSGRTPPPDYPPWPGSPAAELVPAGQAQHVSRRSRVAGDGAPSPRPSTYRRTTRAGTPATTE